MSTWRIYIQETIRVVGDTADNSQQLTASLAKATRGGQDLMEAARNDVTVTAKLADWLEHFIRLEDQVRGKISAAVEATKNAITAYLKGDTEMSGVYINQGSDWSRMFRFALPTQIPIPASHGSVPTSTPVSAPAPTNIPLPTSRSTMPPAPTDPTTTSPSSAFPSPPPPSTTPTPHR